MYDDSGSDAHKVRTRHGPHRAYRGRPVGSAIEDASDEEGIDESPLKGSGRHAGSDSPEDSWPAGFYYEDSNHVEKENYAKLRGPLPALGSVMHWGYDTLVVLD